VIALLYLDRLVVRSDDDLKLTDTNIKIIMTACLALAAKFSDDRYEKNTMFCLYAYTNRKVMRSAMSVILNTINFELFVREEDFNNYMNKLEIIMSKKYA
jgi:hypothetical protein